MECHILNTARLGCIKIGFARITTVDRQLSRHSSIIFDMAI